MNDRTKPNISYVETNGENLINYLIAGYEKITGKTLYPADPLRLFILWLADIMIQQRALIDYSAKQNLPRFAEGKYLDELVEFLNDTIKRLPPQAATTRLKYTLSTLRETATIIPKGSRATIDGNIFFETTKELIINRGEKAGEVEAICTAKGIEGNGFTPGQISQIVDFIPYLKKVENTTTTAGGADTESDDSLYSRYREALATYSTAGPEGAYRFYAKTASANIADVKAISPVPGTCEIRVLLKDGQLPEEETLQKIKDLLSADTIRPLTDKVEVKAAEKTTYNIDLTYYTFNFSEKSADEIEKNVKETVEKYKNWQSEKMGRDINPSKLNQMLMEIGVKRVEIKNPTFKKINDISVAITDKVNIVNGGVEDE
ncbi:MAG: baseplate J/gp47 family protein [Peptostreptococcaceae bacterium]|nr:baseplate J/gp47 family protein [Peptostreptococcaceae bacterium]